MSNTSFAFSFAKPSISTTNHVDARTWTERMFENHDPATGKGVLLPVRAQDASKVAKVGDLNLEPNSLPVILNFAGQVDTFNELNGLVKGSNILVLGGVRQGKAGVGRLLIPVNEVKDFCARVLALAEAVETQLPDLLKNIAPAIE